MIFYIRDIQIASDVTALLNIQNLILLFVFPGVILIKKYITLG